MINIVNTRNWFFLLSILLLLPGLISMIFFGFNLGIDFSSGTTMTLEFDQAIEQPDLRQKIADLGYGEATIQKTSTGDYLVRIREINTEQKEILIAGLEETMDAQIIVKDYYQVSPVVASEVARNAAIAVGMASIFNIIFSGIIPIMSLYLEISERILRFMTIPVILSILPIMLWKVE